MSDSPAMISALRLCPKCGSEIPADAPEGGCPGCLLSAAFVAARDAGDYELLEVVGRGGQGVVYRAHQKSLNRTVALKMISLGSWATEAHLKRFRREAEAAAGLEDPGIVPIHEVGERDGSCYFSMKFVEGGHLDEVVRRTPMSIRQAAELESVTAPSPLCRNYSRYHILVRWLGACRLLLRCSDWIQCSIRCAMIRVFKNCARKSSRDAPHLTWGGGQAFTVIYGVATMRLGRLIAI